MRDQRRDDPESTTSFVAGRPKIDTATDKMPARREGPVPPVPPARRAPRAGRPVVPPPAAPVDATVAGPLVPGAPSVPVVPVVTAAAALTAAVPQVVAAPAPVSPVPLARPGGPGGRPPAPRTGTGPVGRPLRPEPLRPEGLRPEPVRPEPLRPEPVRAASLPEPPVRRPAPEIPSQRTRPPAPAPRRRRRRLQPVVLAAAAVAAAGGVTWGVLSVGAPDREPAPVFGVPVVFQHATALDEAGARYRDFVVAEADALRESTADLVAAVRAGRVAVAQDRYPAARTHWERIQVATEAVTGPDGEELGPAIDGQGVGMDPGETFTGFHRLERDLWVDGLQPDTRQVADDLLADVTALAQGAVALELGGPDLCGSAKELVDFAVVTTLSGRENRFAGTDMSDLAARVEGSEAAVEALRPLLTDVDPALLTELDRRFAETYAVLDRYRTGGGFRPYTDMTAADLKAVADVLDALGEPVSHVGGAVLV
ncbi:EfeM/EfeO family lipoprotein [Pseudonocardia broussonetiae]|uniref:EfeM/EfeO family lipoprotein n=1 Tax=Pseudonocardia broussonetiae TaxID=2736640 RepID=A0A6M6JQ57_9PSEU|nr:EfeM/EfeO family lipoprotein [Pseudonocardia broussonetiae]QJY49117.1 EfeM/EfeO family lipoprotein [Pseudonocardia broussonetiae]